jgi:hypothetical protein
MIGNGREGAMTTRWSAVVMLALAFGATSAVGVVAQPVEGGSGLWMGGRRVVLSSASATVPIPSFARQTKLPCNACHTTFPQLTPFGRLFKLNGYTMTGIEQIKSPASAPVALALDVIPPVSAMVIASSTTLNEPPPNEDGTSVDMPQQLSLFVGEAISPKVGTFLQLTYDDAEGGIGMDNADIRFANHTTFASRPLIYGVTLNNNPTVQDVWNTIPAWGFPYTSSGVAPGPIAGPVLDGAYGQQVAGLGVYGFWDNTLYAEITGYHWAPQGGPHPSDTTVVGELRGVAPYWRVAVTHEFGPASLEVGTLGMIAEQYPTGIIGPFDRFRDIGLDAQYQRALGGASLALHGLYINEKQTLNASITEGAASPIDHSLNLLRVDGSLALPRGLGGNLAFFTTTGTTDALLYPSDPFVGTANGSPNTAGWIGQVSYNAWQNIRLGAQYTMYTKYDGASTNYDGAGRSAADNNALYLFAWLMF